MRILLGQDDGAKGWDRQKGQGISIQFTTVQSVDEIAQRIKDAGGSLDTEPVDTLVAKLRDAIISVQGEVEKVENNGQRDFVRPPTRNYTNGIFLTFKFSGPPTAPAALREKLRLDQNVNRLILQSAN